VPTFIGIYTERIVFRQDRQPVEKTSVVNLLTYVVNWANFQLYCEIEVVVEPQYQHLSYLIVGELLRLRKCQYWNQIAREEV